MISRRALLKSALAAGAVSLTRPLAQLLAAAPAKPKIDLGWALVLAGFCEATYIQFDNPAQFKIPAGYTLVTAFTGQDQQKITAPYGFIAESATAVVIAFRGTRTTTEWITDADVGFTRYPFAAGAGYTHAGFTGIYASMRGQVLPALRRLSPAKRLYVTGHSLGAALATLHALDAAVNARFASLVVYNFASPRVGDRKFAGKYNQAIVTSIRFVNTADIVPQLPLTQTGYAHVKAPWNFTTQTGTRGGNHALTTYTAAVRKAQVR